MNWKLKKRNMVFWGSVAGRQAGAFGVSRQQKAVKCLGVLILVAQIFIQSMSLILLIAVSFIQIKFHFKGCETRIISCERNDSWICHIWVTYWSQLMALLMGKWHFLCLKLWTSAMAFLESGQPVTLFFYHYF